MTASPAPLEFYFDFSSADAYFASERIKDIARRYDRPIQWQVMLLPRLYQRMGATLPVETPQQKAYLMHDLDRSSRFHKLLFRFPDPYPITTELAARALLWMQEHAPHRTQAFVHLMFRSYFVSRIDISKLEALLAMTKVLRIDIAALEASLLSDAYTVALQQQTDAAFARGVCGAPYILVEDEPFLGFERLNQLEAWIARGRF